MTNTWTVARAFRRDVTRRPAYLVLVTIAGKRNEHRVRFDGGHKLVEHRVHSVLAFPQFLEVSPDKTWVQPLHFPTLRQIDLAERAREIADQ